MGRDSRAKLRADRAARLLARARDLRVDARAGHALAPDGRIARSWRRPGYRRGDRAGVGRSGAHLSLGRDRRTRPWVCARDGYAGTGWHAPRRPSPRHPEDRPTNEFGRNGPCRGLAAVRSFRDHRAERQPPHTRRHLGTGREKASRREAVTTVAEPIAPRGVSPSFQAPPPQPVFVDHGKGSRVWDVDGNEYVDFHNGFGVMAVGHAHPLIVRAIGEQAARGTHFAQPVADDAVVAEELSRRFKQPQWRFTNSGPESTLDAVRLARGFTGRDRLIKIEASYHGHHDALLVSVEPPPQLMGPADNPASVPQTEGIPKAVTDLTSVIAFNDLGQLERV